MGTQALGISCCCSLELGQHSLASTSGQSHSLSNHSRAGNAPLLWQFGDGTSRDQSSIHSKLQRPVDFIPHRLVGVRGSKVQRPVGSKVQRLVVSRASLRGSSLWQHRGQFFGEWNGLTSSSSSLLEGSKCAEQELHVCSAFGGGGVARSTARSTEKAGVQQGVWQGVRQGVLRRQVQVRAAAGGEEGEVSNPRRARRPEKPSPPKAPPVPSLPAWTERDLALEDEPLGGRSFFEDRRVRKQRKEMRGPFGGGGRLEAPQDHRSGYVALIGKPNAGKSTLLNSLIGQKLSIVSQKPQTTRHRILGICSEDDYQIILYDTPGVMKAAQHKLDEVMLRNVRTATMNADAVLIIVDITAEEEPVASMLQEGAVDLLSSSPTLVVLNKRDKLKPGEVAKKTQWYELNSGLQLPVLGCSSKFGHGVKEVKDWVVRQLPRGPAYYPKDIVSEHPERFFVAEIVREKIFLQYFQEIPYATQVGCSVFVERPNPDKDYVEVDVVVEKESQKGVIIGKGGSALKQLSTAARKDIEDFLQREIFLEIRVKVYNDWRKNERVVQNFGYDSSRV